MEPSFETQDIREICEVREAAAAALGDAAAQDFAARLSDALAADNFSELQLLLDDQLELRADGTYTLVLATGWVIDGRAGGTNVPKSASGAADWESITRMRIVSIERLS